MSSPRRIFWVVGGMPYVLSIRLLQTHEKAYDNIHGVCMAQVEHLFGFQLCKLVYDSWMGTGMLYYFVMLHYFAMFDVYDLHVLGFGWLGGFEVVSLEPNNGRHTRLCMPFVETPSRDCVVPFCTPTMCSYVASLHTLVQ